MSARQPKVKVSKPDPYMDTLDSRLTRFWQQPSNVFLGDIFKSIICGLSFIEWSAPASSSVSFFLLLLLLLPSFLLLLLLLHTSAKLCAVS
jgi:hypothetical protein